jgi:hypothetical protein
MKKGLMVGKEPQKDGLFRHSGEGRNPELL